MDKFDKGDKHTSQDGIITNKNQVIEPETTENCAHRNSDITSFPIPNTSKTKRSYNIDPLILSPFKSAYFGHSKETRTHFEEKVPSVTTSEEWKKYHEKKEKEVIQEVKQERQKKREIAKKAKEAEK